MRGGRGPPSNRPEPISRPRRRQNHHPRRRRARSSARSISRDAAYRRNAADRSLASCGPLTDCHCHPRADQCRHSGWSPVHGHATNSRSLGLAHRAAPHSHFDRSASSDGNRYLAAKRGSRTSNLSRPSQSSRQPGVVCKLTSISAVLSCGRVCLTLSHRHARRFAQVRALAHRHMDCSNSLQSRPGALIRYPQSVPAYVFVRSRRKRCGSGHNL